MARWQRLFRSTFPARKAFATPCSLSLATADHLDVLVNNAGVILEGDNSIAQLDPETVTKTFQTNTLGPLLVTQAFLPLLSRSNAPASHHMFPAVEGSWPAGMDTWAPAYCLSKTALNAVTCLCAAALPNFSINSVCPGWVRTDMERFRMRPGPLKRS